MENINKHNYIPLPEPIPITEQVWPEDTLPLVVTSTNTYNHALYIKDCIEGILMQKTTFPVRVVIFDDCSTDGTREIVQEYESKFPHVIKGIYPKENTWKKPGRKEALKPRNEIRNTAKYIALCEGDDYWTHPLKLQRQVEFLENNPDYVVCSHSYSYNELSSGKVNSTESPPIYLKKITNNGYSFKLNDLCHYSFLYTLTNVIRKDAMDKFTLDIKNKSYKYARDVHKNYHLLSEGQKGYYINEAMAFYRKHKGGIHSGLDKLTQDEIRANINKEIYLLNPRSFYTIFKYINSEYRLLSTQLKLKKTRIFSYSYLRKFLKINYLLIYLLFYTSGKNLILYKKQFKMVFKDIVIKPLISF